MSNENSEKARNIIQVQYNFKMVEILVGRWKFIGGVPSYLPQDGLSLHPPAASPPHPRATFWSIVSTRQGSATLGY